MVGGGGEVLGGESFYWKGRTFSWGSLGSGFSVGEALIPAGNYVILSESLFPQKVTRTEMTPNNYKRLMR